MTNLPCLFGNSNTVINLEPCRFFREVVSVLEARFSYIVCVCLPSYIPTNRFHQAYEQLEFCNLLQYRKDLQL